MFSGKPLYLCNVIWVAAECGVLQHPSTFHTDVTNFLTAYGRLLVYRLRATIENLRMVGFQFKVRTSDLQYVK
jgi:hypothetical protein